MPSKTLKQAAFMKAIAANPKFAKRAGVSQSVGKEFNMADKKKGKFAAGGKAAVKVDMYNKKLRDKEIGAAGYAKGGSIDGCASKGRTKAKGGN